MIPNPMEDRLQFLSNSIGDPLESLEKLETFIKTQPVVLRRVRPWAIVGIPRGLTRLNCIHQHGPESTYQNLRCDSYVDSCLFYGFSQRHMQTRRRTQFIYYLLYIETAGKQGSLSATYFTRSCHRH
jgi:hypothetical protein